MADAVPAAEFARNFGRYKMQAQREAVPVSSNGASGVRGIAQAEGYAPAIPDG
jgi:hypothetical protein